MSASVDMLIRETPGSIPQAIATKLPRLKSDGLQSVVSNAVRSKKGESKTSVNYVRKSRELRTTLISALLIRWSDRGARFVRLPHFEH